eukprot:TRINITY_DN21408_c0_g1_i1.p1 TRINITY_DN21408_c0_g1~~TRINITY_DN21408_c0_g1_i1.p1  ORF type:complete len:255 (-),score=20.39 TRINITY_DN21408_c0_g1_i1:280-1044(-)
MDLAAQAEPAAPPAQPQVPQIPNSNPAPQPETTVPDTAPEQPPIPVPIVPPSMEPTVVPTVVPSSGPVEPPQVPAPSSDVNYAVLPVSDAAEPAPDAKRQKTEGEAGEKARARSGRPNGVKCVCRCCGAHGFYQRSCGKKHQCLLGKCGTGAGGAWPGGPEMHVSDTNNSAVMYQVTCATCGTALQFALPDSPAYIVCYRCRAKMVIQPMQSDGAGGEVDPNKPQEWQPNNMLEAPQPAVPPLNTAQAQPQQPQ